MSNLPTYVDIIKSYCVGTDAYGQVSNWTVHGSTSTDSKNFVWPASGGAVGTVSAAGTRLLKVHNDTGTTGAVDTWWFLMSFMGADMSLWNGSGSDTGGYIYNFHNVSGDLGGDPNPAAGDFSSGVSCLTLEYQSNTAGVTTLGADYNGGGTLTLATDAAALGFRTSFPVGMIGSSSNSRQQFSFTGISGSTLTGVSGITSGLWTVANGATVNHIEGGLLLHLENYASGGVSWPLPNPTAGSRYDIVMKVVFGRTTGTPATANPGAVTMYVNGSDTASIAITNANILQNMSNWAGTGRPNRAYTQQFVQFWEGGPYIEKAAPRILGNVGPWKHTYCATRVGTTLAEAITDVPVVNIASGSHGGFNWESVATSTGSIPTVYGTMNHHITVADVTSSRGPLPSPNPNNGPCTVNMVFTPDINGSTATAPTDANGGNIVKMTTDVFQLPPSLGGGGGGSTTRPTNSFGKWIAGANTGTLTADFKRVSKYTADANRLIATAGVWLRGIGSGTQTIKAVIYSDNGGEPGSLLGTSAEVTYSGSLTTGAFETFTFSPTVAVISGNSYWIGVITGATTGVGQISWDTITDAGGVAVAQFRAVADTYADGASAQFGTASGTDTRSMAMYVVGAVGVSSSFGPAPVNGVAAVTGNLTARGSKLAASIVGASVVRGTPTTANPTINAVWVPVANYVAAPRGAHHQISSDGTIGAEVTLNPVTHLWEYV